MKMMLEPTKAWDNDVYWKVREDGKR